VEERNSHRAADSLKALMALWRCDRKSCKNLQKWCYLDDVDNRHLLINNEDLQAWNKDIQKAYTTVNVPTDGVLATLQRKNQKKAPNQSGGQSHVIHNHMHMPAPQVPSPLPANTSPERQYGHHTTATEDPRSSPVADVKDPVAEMDRYFASLIEDAPTLVVKLLDAKEKLLGEGLSCAQIKKLPNSEFTRLEIGVGIRMRVEENIKPFKKGRSGI
jgi:hypothetical protein